MSKTVYLAGSMEALSKEEASKWRKDVKEWFDENNFKCVDPTIYYEYGEQYHTNDFEVMRFDLHKVKTADVILVNLNNIRKSIGTCDEIMYAYLNNIPIVGFIESDDELTTEEIIAYVHPWKYVQINRIETGMDAMKKAVIYMENYYA